MRSTEHDTLGLMGLHWMQGRCGSLRGACEVQVAPGYVADAACLCVMFHGEFSRRCEGWGLTAETFVYSVEQKQMVVHTGGIIDYFACVFEAKATRADFLSTFGGRDNDHANRLQPAANLHWVVAEPKVCEPAEVPDPWGLLVRRGRGLSEKKKPGYCPREDFDMYRLSDRLLWKPARQSRHLVLTRCPECCGRVAVKRSWRSEEPAHLMDADPTGVSP